MRGVVGALCDRVEGAASDGWSSVFRCNTGWPGTFLEIERT